MNYYEKHNLEASETPFVCRDLYCMPDGTGFGASNWHEELEIISITGGSGSVLIDGESISVSVGDLVVVNPNRLHTLAAWDKKLSYRFLIVGRSFCLANGFDTNDFLFDALVNDDEMFRLMEELGDIYSVNGDVDFAVPTIRCTVLRLMLCLLKNYSVPNRSDETSDRSAARIKKAMEYIRASFDSDLSLGDVAEFVGMNKYYLSREFHRFAGCSYIEYVNRIRCKRAKQLLKEGKLGVFEVAKATGFQNKSYFAKAFKKYVGMLPGECRKV